MTVISAIFSKYGICVATDSLLAAVGSNITSSLGDGNCKCSYKRILILLGKCLNWELENNRPK